MSSVWLPSQLQCGCEIATSTIQLLLISSHVFYVQSITLRGELGRPTIVSLILFSQCVVVLGVLGFNQPLRQEIRCTENEAVLKMQLVLHCKNCPQ